ncbi:hypothetical protein PF005_g6936 [Phytophthora fragariae]|uniref:Uncharacterized protein n=1 Tax=Phytophthora fragariae TaxID=53985 RepID=A0A6A3FDV1_9STRA|nr:hypothetical protein PF003_g16588 [Phytophthora fragariae]KAE8942521.1 hypothetical protein PF009_g7726 [Phytophthora fragariae]KAE9004614.1 hypothetical protein PF011_g12370 [Phytophthora fragariae]KAE9123137.1 hypothetical protein PF007_g7172 [Phytophthora fragariae]KAE9123850.1 hypothetical protein PF010_g6226 [Phytophthora fragariae]
MLIEFYDEWSDDECSSSEEEGDIMDDNFASGDNDSFLFRRGIKRCAIRKGRQPGGILWLRAHESAACSGEFPTLIPREIDRTLRDQRLCVGCKRNVETEEVVPAR